MLFEHQARLLKKHRAKSKITQEKLGETVYPTKKNTAQIISKMERGEIGIPTRHLKTVQTSLDIPNNALITAIIKDKTKILKQLLDQPEGEA